MSEVDLALKRIVGNKSVRGIIVLDGKNAITHTSFKDENLKVKLSKTLPGLIEKARWMVRDLDPENDLTFLRIRSDTTELMIAPGDDYTLIVVQNVVLVDS